MFVPRRGGGCGAVSHIIRTTASFIFLGLSCSVKRWRSVATSAARILSSSCFDLHSPMLLLRARCGGADAVRGEQPRCAAGELRSVVRVCERT